MVAYITAAYGRFFREFALKGLVFSFAKYNAGSSLRVYVDELPKWEAPDNCELCIIPKNIYQAIIEGDGSFFSRTSFKFEIMLDAQKKFNCGVCWIDCDSLVLDDLGQYITENKVSVVSHGACDEEEVFDCGGGLIVRGKSFAIGGLFYVPYREDIQFLIGMVEKRLSWPEDKTAYWFSDGEQCLINHLVASRSPDVTWLCGNSDAHFNWSFLQFRHPVPFDRGLAGISCRPEGYFVNDKKLAVLMWTSFMLRRHAKQGFRSMDSRVARRFRTEFYRYGQEGFKGWLMQVAYTSYDYLDLAKLRK